MRRHRLRHQRTRSLVEEQHAALSVAEILRSPGRQLTITVPSTGDETQVNLESLLVAHRQLAFSSGRTIVRYYLGCPGCHLRCRALYPAPVGRTALLRCRFCLGLRYQSQTHGRTDERVLTTLERWAKDLESRPGPKGRRYQAVCRRLRRVQVLEVHRGARFVRRAVAQAQKLNPQTSARGTGDSPAPPAKLRRADAERQARDTARRDFPPPPWRRASPRRRTRMGVAEGLPSPPATRVVLAPAPERPEAPAARNRVRSISPPGYGFTRGLSGSS